MARQFTNKFATVTRTEVTYVLQEDLDEKGKPIKGSLEFTLKPMSKKQIANYQDSSSRMNVFNNTILLGNASNEIDLFRSNVVGMKNFIVDGEDYPFKRENNLVDEKIVDILPLDIIGEVAREIIRVSTVSEDALKK
jgi:hypothetical protein